METKPRPVAARGQEEWEGRAAARCVQGSSRPDETFGTRWVWWLPHVVTVTILIATELLS